MAVNDGGLPPILAQKHDSQQQMTCCSVDGDFERGEADGSHDALQLIAIAADRLLP